MDEIWKSKPVLFEFIANPDKQKDWSLKRAADFILGNHCNVFNDNFHFKSTFTKPEDAEQVDRLRKLIGARLVPEKAEISADSRTLEISLFGKTPAAPKSTCPTNWCTS